MAKKSVGDLKEADLAGKRYAPTSERNSYL